MPKLKTVIWFLKRPEYYAQIFQILKRNRNKAKENTREESTRWCEALAISQSEALSAITGSNNFTQLEILFPQAMANARRQSQNTPVEMGGEGAISLIYHLVKDSRPDHCIETGVAYGWSSLAILLGIKENLNSKLISNDMPYVNGGNEDFVGTVVPEYLKNQWELHRMADITGIPLALKKFNHSLDFIHYDSDKSYTGRAWATPLLWDSLKSGGIMMIDDINDNIAFKEFCEQRSLKPVIIEHNMKYVGILKK